MKLRSFQFVSALFAAFVLPAVAAPELLPPLELPVPPVALKESRQWAYGVYVNGEKAGWGVAKMAPSKVGGKECITYSMEMKMQMKALGNTMRIEIVQRENYDIAPPHRALFLEGNTKMDGQERNVSLKHKDGTSYAVEITEAGKQRSAEDLALDLRLTHRTTPEVWTVDPLRKAGDKMGMAEFDFDALKLEPETATLLKESEWTGPGGKIPVWETELYSHNRRLNMKGNMSRIDGNMVNATLGGLFELRLEPEAVAKQAPGDQGDLFLALTLKSDRKLGRASKLKELDVELVGKPGAKPPALPVTVNQNVKINGAGSLIVHITRGGGAKQPASAQDRADNLKSTLRYPKDNEEIKALAAKAVGEAKDDAQKVKNLLRFTDFYLRDSYEKEALSVMDLLKSRKGECSAHALLFTTLARAGGIPAREASGWLYMGDAYQSFGGHAWNEVILDGNWVPVDAIFQQIQLDAGHIQSDSGEVDGDGLEAMASGLRAKIISSEKE